MQFNEFTERFSSGTELRNHENREDEGRNFHGSDSFSRDLRLKPGCWQGVVNGPNSRCQILRDAIAMKLAESPRQLKKWSPILGFRLRAGISHRLREGHELRSGAIPDKWMFVLAK